MSSVKLRAVAVLACVFAAGVVAGVAIERHHGIALIAGPSPEREHAAVLAEMRQAVGLDDAQMAQIEVIIADNQHLVQQMWEQLRPEVQNAMQHVHMQIAALLRPEQLQRFHEWLQQQGQQGQLRHR